MGHASSTVLEGRSAWGRLASICSDRMSKTLCKIWLYCRSLQRCRQTVKA